MSNELNNILAYSGLVAKNNKNKIVLPEIKTSIPNPSENDYKNGYIKRNFAQKLNDKFTTIYELDDKGIELARTSAFYTIVSIYWKIKGTQEEIKFANKKSIKTVFEQMPRLSLYLPNLLQFARIEEFGNSK